MLIVWFDNVLFDPEGVVQYFRTAEGSDYVSPPLPLLLSQPASGINVMFFDH